MMDKNLTGDYPLDSEPENLMTSTHRGRDANLTDSAAIHETLSRARRIETRLTSALVALGVATPAQTPVFYPRDCNGTPRVVAPSRHCSIKDIVDSIPITCQQPVDIFVGSDKVAVVSAFRG